MRADRFECVLFDLDGVLVDSRGPISAALNHGLVAEGLAPEPEARLHGWIGASLRDVYRTLLAERGADPARVDACIAAYREHYAEGSLAGALGFEGIGPALAALARGRRLAVTTSKPVEFAVPILRRLALRDYFTEVFGPPLAGTHREDKTATVARALRALGAAPRATALVGDRHFDVRAARAHRLHSVGVTWGIGSREELLEAGVERLVETPAELAAALAGTG